MSPIPASDPFASTATRDAALSGDGSRDFIDAAKYMDDLTSIGTHHITFMRFLALRPAWPHSSKSVPMKNGAFKLSAGTEYQLDTLQFNADTADGVTVQLSLPTTLSTVSETSARLASPYDVTSFTFVSAAKENDNRGEILWRLQVDDSSVDLPAVQARVPVVVRPRVAFGILNWAVVGGSLLAALIVTVSSLKGIVFEAPTRSLDGYWVLSKGKDFIAIVPAAAFVALAAAVATTVAAAGAVFRRKYGLDSK